MKVDYNGVSILVAAVSAAVVSVGTAIMQWRAMKKADANKQEAIAAREAQTSTIINQAVVPALNSPPPVPPVSAEKGEQG